MSLYRYHAIDYAGQASRGIIDSPSPEAATRELGLKGLYVVSLLEGAGRLASWRRALARRRIGQTDLLVLFQDFSVLLSAGMPLKNCLDDLALSSSCPPLVPVLRDLSQRVERGGSLSQALEAQGELFPATLKTLVAVGEETGTLAQTLGEACQHLERLEKLRGVLRKALLYPALALSATLGALLFWLIFVIPQLGGSLKSLGVKLPALTLALIGASNFLLAHLESCLLLPPLAALAWYAARRHPKSRYLLDRLLLKTPGLRVILYHRLMVGFAEQFAMLLKGGVKVERVFELMIPATGNAYFSAGLARVKENVLGGARIADSLERHQLLPVMALSKIRIGEASGTLDNQLAYLAKWYAKKLDDCVDNLGRILEPVVMVAIGALFALIAMGLLLPIYDLVSTLGKH